MARRQLVTFFVGTEFFGIDILYVKEINRKVQITPIERVEPYVAGLINLRGQIVTIIDVRQRLGLPFDEAAEHCINLKTNGEVRKRNDMSTADDLTSDDSIGLLVDGIGDVQSVDSDDCEAPPRESSDFESPFFDSVVQLDDRLLIVLDIRELVAVQNVESNA